MKIYDIEAQLCSYIIKSCSEDFFVKYSCISEQERLRTRKIIFGRIPTFLKNRSYSPFLRAFEIKRLHLRDLTDVFYEELEQLIHDLVLLEDYFCITSLIQIIDESLSALLRNEVQKFQQYEHIPKNEVLNTNRSSTGVGLLPRCNCCWERKRRLSHLYNRIDNVLVNLLIIENRILDGLNDTHIFLKDDFFPRFKQSKSLKIAASPLWREHNFTFALSSDGKVQYFEVAYTSAQEDRDNELIWNKIQQAGSNNADIIVFPEILGYKSTPQYVSAKLKALSAEQSQHIPAMIILPSHWGRKRNRSTILDRFGNTICIQAKQNPFKAEINGISCLEGFVPSNNITILHFEGIGRIAILICKDFLTTHYIERLMRCFKLTLVIVPSFSTGSYDFKQSFDLCARDDCNVIWINTCAAMETGKEHNFAHIGYVRKRISRFDDESQRLCKMQICDNAFTGTCTRDCMYYETIGSV